MPTLDLCPLTFSLSHPGNFDKAIAEHELAVGLSEAVGDVIGCAVANRLVGECHCELGNYDKALRYQEKHLRLAQKEESNIEQQRAYATIGRTYLYQVNMVKCQVYFSF